MVARGYDGRLWRHLVASVAGIDALIPPAMLRSCIADTRASVSEALPPGYLPGLFQMGVLMVVSRVLCRDMTPEKRCSSEEIADIVRAEVPPPLFMPVVTSVGSMAGSSRLPKPLRLPVSMQLLVSGFVPQELNWSKIWAALGRRP